MSTSRVRPTVVRVVGLPDEWKTEIPPAQIIFIEREIIAGIKTQWPAWNQQWMTGLEKFIRSVVRDELSRANPKDGQRLAGGSDNG